MDAFRRGDVALSISLFDGALALEPRLAPYLWQRGLALFFAGRYEEGAQQFRRDVLVNANDTEESVWAFLCEAKQPELGFEAARSRLLPVGVDRRPVMSAVYALFQGQDGALARLRVAADRDASSRFYAPLYEALFLDAHGETAQARETLQAALQSPYYAAASSTDLMTAVARELGKQIG
jgi:tetratricopeptide (TPR) repeat protein